MNNNEKIKTLIHRTNKNIDISDRTDNFPPVLNEIHTSKKRESQRKNGENEKIFLPRNSVLTDLFEIPHINSLYRVFISMLIIFFINSFASQIFSSGNIFNEFRFIIIGFGKLHIVIGIWLGMQFFATIFYFTYKQWANCRCYFVKVSNQLNAYDYVWIIAYTIFQIIYIAVTSLVIIKYNLPPASSLAVTMEAVRIMMKFHSFIRVVSPRYMNDKISTVDFPPYSAYLYYHFAPTLIYRDSYPRTQKTNWKKVIIYFTEIFACIIFLNFLFGKYISVHWENIGKFGNQTLDMKQGAELYSSSVFPSFIIMVFCFYLLLHCWLNAFAEMLTFADRYFYTDWWNQKGYSSFFRTWNIVVQDWLYAYIYKDVVKFTKNRLLAAITVFFISAAVHEIIIFVSLGYFYPVLSLNFLIPGYLFTLVEKYMSHSAGNILFWITWIMGDGIILTTYTLASIVLQLWKIRF
ncbi:sterol O-acyltransferase 1-like [Arctopsyche grandis]|uniref:sterol O-acyltransferase 1-like n=1 Tax=Arctopsyche grandis TaxID=121162 RepID=UPI00406D6F56